MNKGLILLVEDDENDVFFFQRAAEKANIRNRIELARDGREAINYLSGAHPFADRAKYPLPCLIVLDLNLPQKHGLQVLQWIRSNPELQTTLVVVLTSSTSEEDIHDAYRIGANSYITKLAAPEKMTDLLQVLKQYWLVTNQPPPGCQNSKLDAALLPALSHSPFLSSA
ncbi:MAG: response regulator [Verrucomicrobia subdivision 3 bacterium]|nr:response regulator [Limisphaerales bacterium]